MSPSYADNNNKNRNAQQQVLADTQDLQQRTLEALARTSRQAAETREVGQNTLEQLDTQAKRLEKVEADTTKLKESLKKAEKKQNKFALLSFQFGNRRKARRELRKEEANNSSNNSNNNGGRQPQPQPQTTFKRRGPRPKKKSNDDDDAAEKKNDLNQVMQGSLLVSKEVDTQRKRNELFSDAVPANNNKQTCSNSDDTFVVAKEPSPLTLTETDRRDLQEIESTDRLVDEAIDELGAHVSALFAVSRSVGETTDRQKAQFATVEDNIETTQEQTKLLNRRLKLFNTTAKTTRRERKRECNRKRSSGGMATAKLAAAAAL